MKVVRVTQSSLKRSHFPNSGNIKLPLAPQTLLEVTPKLSLPFQKSDLKEKRGGVLFKWLLPEGYPYSVHVNYFSFTGWTSLQGITSSFIGVLSTQAMLGTLMKISASASSTESDSTWLSNGTASATINWILKDGLGQAGGIALVSLLGSRLDSQARFLRFHSTIIFLIGSLLEFSIPLACTHFTPSSTFLLLASSANILKNVSWMIVSATRAHFMKHLALRGNLGDLTGKAASQMTLASLIGTGLGLLVLGKADSNAFWFAGTWLINALVGIYSTHRACKVAISRQLNPQRIFKVVEIFSKNSSDSKLNSISRYIWTPEIFAKRENFIWPQKSKEFSLYFNELLTEIRFEKFDWIVSMDQLEHKKFSIARNGENSFYIWTLDSSESRDKLLSIITASIVHYNLKEIDAESVLEAFKKQGWDTEHFSCKQLDDKNRSLQLLSSINKNKEE